MMWIQRTILDPQISTLLCLAMILLYALLRSMHHHSAMPIYLPNTSQVDLLPRMKHLIVLSRQCTGVDIGQRSTTQVFLVFLKRSMDS